MALGADLAATLTAWTLAWAPAAPQGQGAPVQPTQTTEDATPPDTENDGPSAPDASAPPAAGGDEETPDAETQQPLAGSEANPPSPDADADAEAEVRPSGGRAREPAPDPSADREAQPQAPTADGEAQDDALGADREAQPQAPTADGEAPSQTTDAQAHAPPGTVEASGDADEAPTDGRLRVTAAEVAQPTPHEAPVDGGTPPPGSTLDQRKDPHKRFFIAGGLGATVVGIGLGIPAIYGVAEIRSIDRELDDMPDDPGRLRNERDDWRTASIVTGVLGATFLLTGLTLIGLGVTRDAPVQVTPEVARDRTGLILSGRF